MSSLQDKKNSKCRFLHCSGSRLYIVDLGLNCVYILSLKDSTSVRKFGTSGKSDGNIFLHYIIDAVGSSGILKGKQKLGVTFNSDKLGGIDFTKFSKLTMCSA